MIKHYIVFIVIVLAGCSSLQQSEPKGEYRYIPITERLKNLSEEDFVLRLRSASLMCENEMLRVYVPSRAVDEMGWEAGQNERSRYFKNCMELKGFERKFFSAQAIKKEKLKEDSERTNEELIKEPRFY